jgi:hypothetical protein
MKIIKDYIRSLEEKDPYQDIWQDLENPIITAVQTKPPETDRQIIERLIARIDELERRIEDLEWYTHED